MSRAETRTPSHQGRILLRDITQAVKRESPHRGSKTTGSRQRTGGTSRDALPRPVAASHCCCPRYIPGGRELRVALHGISALRLRLFTPRRLRVNTSLCPRCVSPSPAVWRNKGSRSDRITSWDYLQCIQVLELYSVGLVTQSISIPIRVCGRSALPASSTCILSSNCTFRLKMPHLRPAPPLIYFANSTRERDVLHPRVHVGDPEAFRTPRPAGNRRRARSRRPSRAGPGSGARLSQATPPHPLRPLLLNIPNCGVCLRTLEDMKDPKLRSAASISAARYASRHYCFKMGAVFLAASRGANCEIFVALTS